MGGREEEREGWKEEGKKEEGKKGGRKERRRKGRRRKEGNEGRIGQKRVKNVHNGISSTMFSLLTRMSYCTLHVLNRFIFKTDGRCASVHMYVCVCVRLAGRRMLRNDCSS